MLSRCLAVVIVLLPAYACAADAWFLGAQGGVSTLSADGGTAINSGSALVSSYKPENGPVLQVFGGHHWNDYLSVQGNYVWNSNDLTLTSVVSGADAFYEQIRTSGQHQVSADLLVYFRNLRSGIRPYLAVGGGVIRFASAQRSLTEAHGTTSPPPREFTSTAPAIRFSVGIDLRIRRNWYFRYSFAEIIRGNPVSAQLSPPGQRNLSNFQNLLGFFRSF
ncbi:MAG: outer membrane beta-barrel protein [Bryobacteraceae bacterium]